MPMPELIVAADCVYLESTFSALVQTLADASDESTEILFCYQKRRKADRRFFALLRKQFSWTDVSISIFKPNPWLTVIHPDLD